MSTSSSLKKVLNTWHLWAMAVGLVISGEYFGWNYGWGVAGTVGFLLSTVVVTIMYIAFVFSFTELTTSIPHAGGPFAYAYQAFGAFGGLIAGYATLVEFLLSTPPIAIALGSYLHFLYPTIAVTPAAIACFIIFTAINCIGIKESAVFTLVMTLLAVVELLIFIGIVSPHFSFGNFMQHNMPFGIKGIFAGLPFAIWFFLGIEGVAMVAEEVKAPNTTIPRGYLTGIFTLLLLAVGVMLATGGVGNWQLLSNIDYPLPEAIGMVVGKGNSLTKLFAGIGVFGLMASFHSLITSSSRQLFALSRSNYLPKFLSHIHPKFQTPIHALVIGAIIGIVAIMSGTTSQLIILSVLGAVVMYIISMVSVFALRKNQPQLVRPFKIPFYPIMPFIALLLSVVCLIAIVYYNWQVSLLFFIILLIILLLYKGLDKYRSIMHD
ncbi:ethanolamine permease [Parasediminibacterium paludis]|uniref:Ethanolamine permease n=1 Tax=Parasediminibacterium paludis TaxID=908966 RepID=A0ABV8PWD4_9BACT